MTNSEKLNRTIETAKTNFATAGPACQPWRKATAVINDHMVQVNIFGSDDANPIIWVDNSSEPLDINTALARIA